MVNFNAKIFGWRIGFAMNVRKERNQEIIGYSNRCTNGQYIIFLDYDRIELDWVIGEVKRLQEDFKLGNFFIFKSGKKNFHAVCLDKVSLSFYQGILNNSSVDRKYIDVPMKYGRVIWTLRLSSKNSQQISFLETVSSSHDHLRMKSLAHARVLTNLFGIDPIIKAPTDGELDLILARYNV